MKTVSSFSGIFVCLLCVICITGCDLELEDVHAYNTRIRRNFLPEIELEWIAMTPFVGDGDPVSGEVNLVAESDRYLYVICEDSSGRSLVAIGTTDGEVVRTMTLSANWSTYFWFLLAASSEDRIIGKIDYSHYAEAVVADVGTGEEWSFRIGEYFHGSGSPVLFDGQIVWIPMYRYTEEFCECTDCIVERTTSPRTSYTICYELPEDDTGEIEPGTYLVGYDMSSERIDRMILPYEYVSYFPHNGGLFVLADEGDNLHCLYLSQTETGELSTVAEAEYELSRTWTSGDAYVSFADTDVFFAVKGTVFRFDTVMQTVTMKRLDDIHYLYDLAVTVDGDIVLKYKPDSGQMVRVAVYDWERAEELYDVPLFRETYTPHGTVGYDLDTPYELIVTGDGIYTFTESYVLTRIDAATGEHSDIGVVADWKADSDSDPFILQSGDSIWLETGIPPGVGKLDLGEIQVAQEE